MRCFNQVKHDYLDIDRITRGQRLADISYLYAMLRDILRLCYQRRVHGVVYLLIKYVAICRPVKPFFCPFGIKDKATMRTWMWCSAFCCIIRFITILASKLFCHDLSLPLYPNTSFSGLASQVRNGLVRYLQKSFITQENLLRNRILFE